MIGQTQGRRRQLTPFPWEALDRPTRTAVAAAAQAREQLAPWLSTAEVARAASALLDVPVEVQVRGVRARAAPLAPSEARVILEADGAQVAVDLEASLVVRLCEVVLRKRPAWVMPGARLSAELIGAASALVVAVARRSGPGAVWRLGRQIPQARCAVVDALIIIGDDVFEATATIPLDALPPPRPVFDAHALVSLGALPMSLPLVAATLSLSRQELSSLTRGAALCPGASWSISLAEDGSFSGHGALIHGRSERGLRCTLRSGLGGDPAVVLTPGATTLLWDAPMPQDPDEMSGPPPVASAAEALEDVPVVLRVEVATITLPAKDWARLTAGDVLATGVRLGEPVSLRAGGVTFARGELCNLEGELAVRILERKGQDE